MKTAEQHNEDWESLPWTSSGRESSRIKWSAKRIAWIRDVQREAWDAGALTVGREVQDILVHAADTFNASLHVGRIDPAKLEGRP